jgi:four helix bundle protein
MGAEMEPQESNALYRESVAWRKSMELTAQIYKTTQRFPPEERFGLTNQLRRSSVSIPSKIAEGKGRLTSGELAQFIGHARGSAMEVQTQLELHLCLTLEIKLRYSLRKIGRQRC